MSPFSIPSPLIDSASVSTKDVDLRLFSLAGGSKRSSYVHFRFPIFVADTLSKVRSFVVTEFPSSMNFFLRMRIIEKEKRMLLPNTAKYWVACRFNLKLEALRFRLGFVSS